MNWETWAKHRAALANDTWTAWGKWPADVQDAMHMIATDNTQLLSYEGLWIDRAVTSSYHAGTTYRVSPSWPGPAKPEPVAEYEDCKAGISGDGSTYQYTYGIGSCTHVRVLSCAITNPRFAGYVMPDGKLRPRLIFDLQKDGSYRLRVPMAVRLRKEVVR